MFPPKDSISQTQSGPPANTSALSTGLRISVREFRFEGNTAFSSNDLAKVTAPYLHREITSEELEEARRAVSAYYINHGYINSGAVIPDQKPKDGVVTLHIVEGILSEIDVSGNRWLRRSYIEERLQRWSGKPLSLVRLQEGLQLLRQNPNVQRINAELRPGATPGQSILDVRVKDQNPFRLGLQIDNQRPPSVGSEEVSLLAGDRNLTGHSDDLELSYGIAHATRDGWEFSGDNNIAGSYTLPITPYDTTIQIHADRNDYAIFEEPFANLDIASSSYNDGAALRQPVYQTANRELALSVAFDRRHSQTFLAGKPFVISAGSDSNGVENVSVLRLGQEWMDRSADHVLALRSTFNIGLDVFDATDNGTSRNGTFLDWQGQFQYVQRLFRTANQLILRANAQWTDDPLLSLEQLSLGGFYTVRGYRENQLVRDRGVFASVEFRLPVLYDKTGNGIIQLAPFFDYGGASNISGSDRGFESLYSAGLGLLINPNKHCNAQLYWGHPFTNVKNTHNDPQDLGLHFRVNLELF